MAMNLSVKVEIVFKKHTLFVVKILGGMTKEHAGRPHSGRNTAETRYVVFSNASTNMASILLRLVISPLIGSESGGVLSLLSVSLLILPHHKHNENKKKKK